MPVEFSRAHRSEEPLTLVMIDLDHFKRYNDRRGHPAGDAVLRGAAQAWRKQLRPTDMLVRYGGEEFTLVLPGIDADQAAQLVDRLRGRSQTAKLSPRELPRGTVRRQPLKCFNERIRHCCKPRKRDAIERWWPAASRRSPCP